MNDEDILKNTDIQKIAEKGKEIYEKVKSKYEPANIGKFLAIETDSGEIFMGENSVEAVSVAKERFADKIFYVVKIGHESTEVMSRVVSRTYGWS
ncbi:MAG: hypothetical protein Q8R13_04170 [bacterium]|nr:hypothetical protein [bacterium]MDZ4296478.1 hypothetical protein [Patescibacteria group bacterium]